MTKGSRPIGAIGWIGITVTTAYALAVAWFVDGRWSDLQDLKLNELGDFLAGAFGPLAILWLVLGFFQQGIELRQNSVALHLQAEELKNSVEQQTALANVARDQLAADLQNIQEQRERAKREDYERKARAQPNFHFSVGGSHSEESTHTVGITNTGQRCTDITILTTGIEQEFTPNRCPYLDSTNNLKTSITLPRFTNERKFFISIKYRDGIGDYGTQKFQVDLEDSGQSYYKPKFTAIAVTDKTPAET